MGDFGVVGGGRDADSSDRDAGGGSGGYPRFDKPLHSKPLHRKTQLLQTIEGEIIPRLMLVHRIADGRQDLPAAGQVSPCAADVQQLAELAVAADTERALRFVDSLMQRGVSLESTYLDLLAPTARRLGAMWEEDQNDFMQVTIGLWRLQEVLHELGPAFLNESEPAEPGRRIFLVPAPGEQHTFGAVIVAEFFRRAGWDVWDDPGASRDEILRIVRSEWFSVVGLSVSCAENRESLPSVIRAIRRVSRNPAIGIMVGGQTFIDHPERVALVGADATANDGRQATLQAQNLLSLLASRT